MHGFEPCGIGSIPFAPVFCCHSSTDKTIGYEPIDGGSIPSGNATIMQNLKDFYTEAQATMVLFRSPVSYRAGLDAAKWAEMWLYPRDKTEALARILNADDPEVLELLDYCHLLDSPDLVLSEWVSLKEAMELITISKETLYQITKRTARPRVPYELVSGKMVFSRQGLLALRGKR